MFRFLLLLMLSVSLPAAEKLLYEYKFDDGKLSGWQVEGPGKASVVNGKLILEPEFFPEMEKLMQAGKITSHNVQDEYRPYLMEAFKKKGYDLNPYMIDKNGGKLFMGGHFNFWNKQTVKGDFAIEFDFRSLSESSLHMIMFCASGLKGESIFAKNMPKRVGVAQEIMFGPMYQYRVSFFHPTRKTANMRRAPGRNMVAKGPDLCSRIKGASRGRIERRGSLVRYLVDGKEVLTYKDEAPLKGGHWGFRVMVCGKGEYDNIKVYQLTKSE